MKGKEWVADYLSFTRKDRIGILIISALILLVFFLPKLIPGKTAVKPGTTDTAWIAAVKKLEIEQDTVAEDRTRKTDDVYAYQYDRSQNNYPNSSKTELFYFDPNTVSADGWKKLGLRDKTIRTILNYLSKGGHFQKPEDLQRIYGLHPDEFERLEPYIKIEAPPQNQYQERFVAVKQQNEAPARLYTPRYTIIDINTADTFAFIALPGIGSKLAARIINFRDKLGGFHSVSQVGETFGLPDSTFQKIKAYLKLENVFVRKININTATVDELKAHPYIRYIIARPIIAYRNEHGSFLKIEDLKKVMAVTDEIYNKISSYITIDN